MDLRKLTDVTILAIDGVEEEEEEDQNSEKPSMGLVQSGCKTKKKKNKGRAVTKTKATAQNEQQRHLDGQIYQSTAQSNDNGNNGIVQRGNGEGNARMMEMGGGRRPTNLGATVEMEKRHNLLLTPTIPPMVVADSSLVPSTRRHSSFFLPTIHSQNDPHSPLSPSAVASTFILSSWRHRNSPNKQNSSTERNVPERALTTAAAEEGGSCTSGEGGGNSPPYLLSELSQEMLAQIIRLFPFPQSAANIERPKIYRTSSQPATFVPSSSSAEEEESKSSQKEAKMAAIEICKSNEEEEKNCGEEKVATAFSQPPSSTASSSPSPVLPIHQSQQQQFDCLLVQKANGPFERLRRAASNLTGGTKREMAKNLRVFEGAESAMASNKSNGKKNGALSRLCRISVETMAITALPLDCWLKERLKNWVQLSGHKGTIVPASNNSLWKKQSPGNSGEAIAYAEIMRDPELRGITPKFYREIQHRNEAFIEIQDLLAEFPNTLSRAVMDIKIGTRTFLESEVANRSRRPDLYRKMMELAPDEPTKEEHREGAITKLRYMQFREMKSSSAALGFRIEAAQLPGGIFRKDFKKLSTRAQVQKALMDFFGPRRQTVKMQLLTRIKQIRNAVQFSEFFASHEVVGSSILLIYDDKKAGAWLIDFAKCTKMEGQNRLSHRAEWELGNHEDGYLIGLDSLVELLAEGENMAEMKEKNEDEERHKIDGT